MCIQFFLIPYLIKQISHKTLEENISSTFYSIKILKLVLKYHVFKILLLLAFINIYIKLQSSDLFSDKWSHIPRSIESQTLMYLTPRFKNKFSMIKTAWHVQKSTVLEFKALRNYETAWTFISKLIATIIDEALN